MNEYQNLRQEQVERWVEILDWSTVPSKFLTEDIIQKFGTSVEGLVLRLYLENAWEKVVLKTDEIEFPNRKFFFIDKELSFIISGPDFYVSIFIWKFFEKYHQNNVNIYSRIRAFICGYITNICKLYPTVKMGVFNVQCYNQIDFMEEMKNHFFGK